VFVRVASTFLTSGLLPLTTSNDLHCPSKRYHWYHPQAVSYQWLLRTHRPIAEAIPGEPNCVITSGLLITQEWYRPSDRQPQRTAAVSMLENLYRIAPGESRKD